MPALEKYVVGPILQLVGQPSAEDFLTSVHGLYEMSRSTVREDILYS